MSHWDDVSFWFDAESTDGEPLVGEFDLVLTACSDGAQTHTYEGVAAGSVLAAPYDKFTAQCRLSASDGEWQVVMSVDLDFETPMRIESENFDISRLNKGDVLAGFNRGVAGSWRYVGDAKVTPMNASPYHIVRAAGDFECHSGPSLIRNSAAYLPSYRLAGDTPEQIAMSYKAYDSPVTMSFRAAAPTT